MVQEIQTHLMTGDELMISIINNNISQFTADFTISDTGEVFLPDWAISELWQVSNLINDDTYVEVTVELIQNEEVVHELTCDIYDDTRFPHEIEDCIEESIHLIGKNLKKANITSKQRRKNNGI